MMTTIKGFSKRYALLIYFTLAFIISWGAMLILAGPAGIPATADQIMVLGLAMLLGPSIASILLIGFISGGQGYRELVSRWFKYRVGIRWYLVALLTAPLTTVAVLLGLSLFSPAFLPHIFTADDKATLLLGGIVGGLIVGCGEELGWTGFALPKMRLRYSIFSTGLLIGLLWGAWHFLLFWENDSFSGAFPLALLIARLFTWLPAYRILMVWVYAHTESLFVVILMHVSLVATLAIFDPPVLGGTLLTLILARAAVLWGIVAVVILAQRRKVNQTRRGIGNSIS